MKILTWRYKGLSRVTALRHPPPPQKKPQGLIYPLRLPSPIYPSNQQISFTPPPPPNGIAKVLRSVSTIYPSPNRQGLIYPSNRQVQFTPKLPSMILLLPGNCQGLIYPSNRQGLISVHGGGWVPTWSCSNLFTMDSTPPSSAQHGDLTLLQETPCLCSLPT